MLLVSIVFLHGQVAIGIPIVVPCKSPTLQYRGDVVISGFLKPKRSESIYAPWGALIKKFNVKPGDSVKAGDVIAEIDLSMQNWSGAYLRSLYAMQKSSDKLSDIQGKWLQQKADRARKMVELGALPRNDLEKIDQELSSFESSLRQRKNSLQDMAKKIAENDQQLRLSNFIAPIDGVVTEMAVDPRQLVGMFQVEYQGLVARIDSPGEYIVEGHALGSQVNKISVGQTCSVKAGPNWTFPCRISQMSPVARPSESGGQTASFAGYEEGPKFQSFPVYAEFTAKNQNLPGGFLAQIIVANPSPTTKAASEQQSADFNGKCELW
jgi:multidrug efflux pump subunit AcrA (membrane-fusion protein)